MNSSYCYWIPIYTQYPYTPVITNARAPLIEYWRKYLLQKAMSVYKWTMPEEWSENYFKYLLYGVGFVSVVYTWQYGWVPQRCALTGLNLFEEPDGIMVQNTFISNLNRKIGNGCVLFKFNPDFTGVTDIIDTYATQLAELHLTAYSNMQNSKVSFVLTAEDKKMAESLKKMFDQILSGELAVTIKSNLNGRWDVFSQNVKQNYIVSDILTDMRKLMNMFNTDFGIPNANTEKKERLITDEVNANNGDTKILPQQRLDNFKAVCTQLNRMAGTTLMSVDWNTALKQEGGNSNNVLPKSE